VQPSGEDTPPGLRPSGQSGEGGGGRGKARLIVPIVVVVAVVAAVVVAVVASGGSDNGKASSTTTVVASKGATNAASATLLPPALSYAKAKAEGKADTIDWGNRCDTDLGLLALPLFPQQQCFAPFKGDNGGATTTGVTGDTIKVVVYLAQANDPVLKFIYSQIQNNDTPTQTFATYEGYNEMFSKYYETYGRKVQMIRFDATGTVSDSVAATADAETIAHDIKPFMVFGGPILTNAFADTLAQNKVMCVSCTPGQPAQWYIDRAPYVWDILASPEERQLMVAEYLGKRLANRDAIHAGDPTMHDKKRVLGLISINSSDQSKQLRDEFTKLLKDKYGVEFASIQTYNLPTELAGTGRDIISQMKQAGVTSVVFDGDPLAPQTLTKIAAQQNYFPEWIITGSLLVDTQAFSRTYDQSEWKNAFGPSALFARIDPNKAGALYLYNWYYGKPAPADQSTPVIVPNVQFLYNALQPLGSQVTPDNFQKVYFGGAIIPSTPVTPQISYGNRGFFPFTDYAALDDMTEVWWDPTATGLDELGRQGTGMWQFVDGGKRYLPGQWPTTAPKVFDPAGAVTIYNQPPPEAQIKNDYQPLR
jgi:hypothetical protein